MTYRTAKMLFQILAIILLAIGLFSCTANSAIKIGVLFPNDANRWTKDQALLESYAKESGIAIMFRTANNDDELQLQQSLELIKEGVDVIILVAVNQVTAASIVRDAHAEGVKVIGYERIVNDCDLDYFVSYNSEELGKIMIDYALNLKPEGNYVFLFGDAMDANAVAIKETQDAVVKPLVDAKKIKIVYKGFQDEWARDFAKNTMTRVLDFSAEKIDVILSSHCELALGATDALQDAGIAYKHKITIISQDARIESCANILDGKISMLLFKPVKLISRTAFDIALKVAKHKRVSEVNKKVNNGRIDVPAIMLKPIVVDINTMKSVLTADELKYVEQIGGSK